MKTDTWGARFSTSPVCPLVWTAPPSSPQTPSYPFLKTLFSRPLPREAQPPHPHPVRSAPWKSRPRGLSLAFSSPWVPGLSRAITAQTPAMSLQTYRLLRAWKISSYLRPFTQLRGTEQTADRLSRSGSTEATSRPPAPEVRGRHPQLAAGHRFHTGRTARGETVNAETHRIRKQSLKVAVDLREARARLG